MQEEDSIEVDHNPKKEDLMQSTTNMENPTVVRKRTIIHTIEGEKRKISIVVTKEVKTLTMMKDIREMKEDLRRDHSEELVSSAEVKDIEHLNAIKESAVRKLSIPKERLMWKSLFDPLIQLGNLRKEIHC